MTMVSTDTAGRSGTAPRPPLMVDAPISVDRWPTEIPLLFVVGLVSAGIWLLLIVSILGLIYGALLGAFFFVAHAVFVAHVRGNAVRLGHDQFPEIYASVESLARRMGMTRVPEVYLMQAGGTLNALASKFMRANIIVLFSDLLEACGEDASARDMIIAHELGHLRAGHLRWAWFLLPGSFVPFLGTALSRAREYTCDRYGLAGAGRRDSALTGLAILAAGGKHGPLVNLEAMVRQRESLNTGWMKIGEWLSTHPPLVSRIAALDPALDALTDSSAAGAVRGLGIIGAAVATPVVLALVGAMALVSAAGLLRDPSAKQDVSAEDAAQAEAEALFEQLTGTPARSAPRRQQPEETAAATPATVDFGQEMAAIQAQMGLETLANIVELERTAGTIPPDVNALYAKLAARQPGQTEPRDPYDGQRFGYDQRDGQYVLWSVGPDKESGTPDDIVKRN